MKKWTTNEGESTDQKINVVLAIDQLFKHLVALVIMQIGVNMHVDFNEDETGVDRCHCHTDTYADRMEEIDCRVDAAAEL